jgi:hypothetical protein
VATMTREEVRAVLGPVDDGLVVEILGTGASPEELAKAYAWITDDEVPMNAGRPLASGRVSLLVDILEAAEEEAPAAAVVHGSSAWTQWAYPRLGSGDADVARASELQHAVERVGGDLHLGRPALVGARAQPVADHPLPPRDGGLGSGALVVP